MTANVTDVDTFTDPVTVPLDGESATSASLLGSVQKLANRTRYLYSRLTNLSGMYEDNVARIPMTAAAQVQNGGWSEQGDGTWRSESGDSGLYIPIDAANFPHGCTITAYTVRVDPGAARAGNARMYVEIRKKTAAGVATAVGDQTFDNAGASEQTIPVSSVSHTLDRSLYEYFLHVRSGNTGGTNKDTFLGASVTRSLP